MSAIRKWNRREFMRITGGGAAWLALGGCQGNRTNPAVGAAGKPNIVFITADDLGWNDIGYNGSEIRTPNLDRLAKEGRIFDQHYVMPTCTPTRVGLMSGRYPSRFGVLSPAYGKIFDDDTITLPEALKRSGYTTHISGKWHMGSPPEFTPLKYGFTTSYGYFHGQIDPYTHHYKTGVRSWHRNDEYLDEQGHATDLITEEAVRVIQAKHENPFFLYVAYSVPHFPLKEPDNWLSMYPEIKEESRKWYAASVTHMDDGIGRIVKALDETGLRKNTLFIFVSDNGGQKSWHSDTQYKGRYAELPHTVLGNNLPLRGWKGDCYEGGIRVPALVNWPDALKSGKIEPPAHIVDWMPTLCHLVGYTSEKDLQWDGVNIWPYIKDSVGLNPNRTLYWKTPGASAVRRDDIKLIVYNNNKTELFDLRKDPYEKNNLAEKESQRAAEWKALLEQIARVDRERKS
jgi:arylsulfatase A-like enzyme